MKIINNTAALLCAAIAIGAATVPLQAAAQNRLDAGTVNTSWWNCPTSTGSTYRIGLAGASQAKEEAMRNKGCTRISGKDMFPFLPWPN